MIEAEGGTADVVGHSMGENTAACLAGVMSFEDCIGLVHLRGQLFDTVPSLTPPTTAGVMVEATASFMSATARSPAAVSTPASA